MNQQSEKLRGCEQNQRKQSTFRYNYKEEMILDSLGKSNP